MPDDRALFFEKIPEARSRVAYFDRYAEQLQEMQNKINLIGSSTLPRLWLRHFLDSAQLLPRIADPQNKILLDIGSGAGFPGLVLAILGVGQVHLVESTKKKADFLRRVSHETACHDRIQVHSERIEALESFHVDIITARACASLEQLLQWILPFLHEQTQCLFLKGQRAEEETQRALKNWEFDLKVYPSLSDCRGSILHMKQIQQKTCAH